ncbi:MAG: YjfB family protein [Clostridium sp.]|nr:YjfB family protein [Clostridium sp.]
MSMDIAGMSFALANASLQNDVSVAVLSKAMDTSEAIGSGMVQMLDAAAMEQSVNPNVGSSLDLKI